jgi:hypothetical protein
MRPLVALCLLAAGAHALVAPVRVAYSGKTAFGGLARTGGGMTRGAPDGGATRFARALDSRVGYAAASRRSRIISTATQDPPQKLAKMSPDEKLVKYVFDRGGKRVRARNQRRRRARSSPRWAARARPSSRRQRAHDRV